MHAKTDIALRRHLPPKFQRISRRGRADLGRVAGYAGVALAIDLNVIRLHLTMMDSIISRVVLAPICLLSWPA